jgi:hypothetical protein
MRCLHLVIPFAVALGASAAPFAPAIAQIDLNVTVDTPPPELPVYEQPPLPAPGYIFQPGYWAYGSEGYFWVPATWVEPPQPGLLWTPGYWGWNGGHYLFNAGYWGATVGYYGGINYGFGYGGLGYEGGYWRGGNFFYNSAVNRFGGVHITNVYVRNVTNVTVNRFAFNGPGGVDRRPTPAELQAAREPHVQPTALQIQHVQAAQQNHALLASVNHGRPAITATPRPAAFGGAAAPHAGAPGPHPTNQVAGRPVAQPHPYTAQPRAHVATPHSTTVQQRPMAAEPRANAVQPRPVVRTPVARAPQPVMHQPERMSAPRPAPAMAPRAPVEPRAAAPAAPRPAPHPAPAAHEEKPKR